MIVTLAIDDAAHAWFDQLRREYFPPEMLRVGAHVTMFHALPGDQEGQVRAVLAREAAKTAAFPVAVTGTRFLGRGVAFALAAPAATALRAALAADFAPFLTRQDSAPWRPHITIQNKVPPAQARRTETILAALAPPPITAPGIALWHYENGPWRLLQQFAFGEPNNTNN